MWIQVSHDSSVGEWMELTVYPPCGPGSIPATMEEYFEGFSPGWLHFANPSLAWVAEMSQSPFSGATKLVDIEEEGRRSTTDRQWLKEVNLMREKAESDAQTWKLIRG